MRESWPTSVSMAQFANVAFSGSSLLHGFNQRFAKGQQFRRQKMCHITLYEESGELCLLSALLGDNRDIFFPKLSKRLHLITFSEIATHFLRERGYRAFECLSENDARDRAAELIDNKKWPCYFFNSDTTGEKDFEEFFTDSESLDLDRFETIGVVQNKPEFDQSKLDEFVDGIHALGKDNLVKR